MRTTRSLSFAAIILLFAGCASTDYVGEKYPATEHVDIYFDAVDIDHDYKVMGTAKTSAGEYMSFEAIQEQLVKDAKSKGADAILIEGMDTVVTGTTTTTSGGTTTSKDGEKKKEKSSTQYDEISVTQDIKDRVISAKLLKYKK